MSDGILEPAPNPSQPALLRLSGVTKTYGPTRAIDGLSFTVATGETMTVDFGASLVTIT